MKSLTYKPSDISIPYTPGSECFYEIYKGDEYPHYQMYVVDNKREVEKDVAIFVIQQGNEGDYFFCTRKGRMSSVKEMQVKRLLLISIDAHHPITSIDEIRPDLYMIGIEFNVFSHEKATILMDCNGIGQRKLLFGKSSKLNGYVYVEESSFNGDGLSRKLKFQGDASLIQSEAIFNDDLTHIDVVRSCKDVSYYNGGISGISLMYQKYQIPLNTILILGGGGNILASGFKQRFQQSHVFSVEFDPVVHEAAVKYFDFHQDIISIVDDGRNTVMKGKWDLIFIDIDRKPLDDNDVAAPHEDFIDDTFMNNMLKHLNPQGCIIYNVVSRNEEKRYHIYDIIKQHFNKVYCWDSDEDVNTLLFCFMRTDIDLLVPNDDNDEEINKFIELTTLLN